MPQVKIYHINHTSINTKELRKFLVTRLHLFNKLPYIDPNMTIYGHPSTER